MDEKVHENAAKCFLFPLTFMHRSYFKHIRQQKTTSETGQILLVRLMAMCLCDNWRLLIKQRLAAIEDKVAKRITLIELGYMLFGIKIVKNVHHLRILEINHKYDKMSNR